MNKDGQIQYYDLDKEDEAKAHFEMEEKYARLLKKIADSQGDRLFNIERPLEPVDNIPLTSDQARFFSSKGSIFRKLWAKRMARGLSPTLAIQLKGMIDNFVKYEKKQS